MTEITHKFDQLPPAIQRFILQWGDMGGQWGVNRTIAQIHALLYVSDRPLNAEDIAETLGVARSNVSNSLKELQAWKIVKRVPVPGDRRDHFAAEDDVWEMAMRIASIRKERELNPALETLETCLAEAENDSRVSATQRARLEAMQEFTGSMDRWYEQMLKVPPATLLRMIKMGNTIVGLLGFGARAQKPET
ncbi:MarR family transcriptional regulator [Maricaulis sp.]|uniref:GbsR/MarR family transcriptional regulator n=1 Tax=Maricaulis sp. TaxID=1486257 RepID=UPI00261E128C|nr:MarR family transcriptional regulator [Maricaulis sp.]